MSQKLQPIWAESLLSLEEWKEQAQKYPQSYSTKEPPTMFECDFKWRYGMGERLSAKEIETISKKLDLFRAYRIKMLEEEKVKA